MRVPRNEASAYPSPHSWRQIIYYASDGLVGGWRGVCCSLRSFCGTTWQIGELRAGEETVCQWMIKSGWEKAGEPGKGGWENTAPWRTVNHIKENIQCEGKKDDKCDEYS